MQTPDVMIHIKDSLTPAQRAAIETEMRAIDGVIAPRFNRPCMLTVLYNAERTNAAALLEAVAGRGYRARLVAI